MRARIGLWLIAGTVALGACHANPSPVAASAGDDGGPPPPPPRATAEASPAPSAETDTTLAAVCPAMMTAIPGGTFNLLQEGAEQEQFETTIDPFCLDVTEVTVSEYESCVQAGKCAKPGDRTRAKGGYCNWGDDARRNHPVNCVDWFQAQAYCEWAGKRLPTNAEWEFAARGGTEYRTYPWGNDEPDGTHACWNRSDGTCVAGSHPPEAFGLRDMGGNVGEWVLDWMRPYAPGSEHYRGPRTGRYRTIRGASWGAQMVFLPAHIRGWLPPNERQAGNGIRCARSR